MGDTQTSEDKSEAFLITKRNQDGMLAWGLLRIWYLSISGMGICRRMGRVMNPSHSQKDEEGMRDIEMWIAEMKELRALGEVELPAR